MSLKASETIEVEDIVSADTTNHNGPPGAANIHSYRTSSNGFHGDGGYRGQTPEPDIIGRMNTDLAGHAQQTARVQAASAVSNAGQFDGGQGHRNTNVKSSLAVTSGHQLESFVSGPGDNRGSVEVRGGDDRAGVVGSDVEDYAQYRELHKVSGNQGSSIMDSQHTETI